MRKAILTMVVVCALTSLAMAVPTGPGGTFYFISGLNTTSGSFDIWTMCVDTDWDIVDPTTGNKITTGACEQLDTITVAGGSVSSNVEAWPPAGGGAAYKQASLLLYYEDSATTYHDYVVRDSSGGLSTEMFGTSAAAPAANTSYASGAVANHFVVGSDWMPSADTSSYGLLNVSSAAGGTAASLWTDSDTDGTYDGVRTGPDNSYPWRAYQNPLMHAGNSYTIGGQTPTGAMVVLGAGSSPFTSSYAAYIDVTYRMANDTYVTASRMWTNDPAILVAENINHSATRAVIGDTDGDGVADCYYPHSTGEIWRGVDSTGDGDWWDAGERTLVLSTGVYQMSSYSDLQLVQLGGPGNYGEPGLEVYHPGGLWAILIWKNREYSYTQNGVTLWLLDEYGDPDPTTLKLINYHTTTGGGDSTMLDMQNAMVGKPSFGFSARCDS